MDDNPDRQILDVGDPAPAGRPRHRHSADVLSADAVVALSANWTLQRESERQ
jgi:hypothetical protein